MNNIQSNTGRISELADSIQSLTLDLEEATPLDNVQRGRFLSLSNAVNSLAESVNKEARKIDQLCSEQANEGPLTVVNIHKEEEAKPTLSPAWYEYGLNGEITDLALTDGLDHCFDEVRAISELLIHASRDSDLVIDESTLSQIGLMLCDKMKEATNYVDQWRKPNTNIKQ